MKIFKMTEDAHLPTKADGDRAYDLYSIEDKEIRFGEVVMVRTGIKIGFPEGYHGIIKPRSGMAAKHGIHVLAGVIDSSYIGEIIVVLTKVKSEKEASLFDSSEISYSIKKGDRIAQIKLEKDVTFEVQQVFNEEELGMSERQDKGFGSSGL
jgi:dUTP pyrophosphatase